MGLAGDLLNSVHDVCDVLFLINCSPKLKTEAKVYFVRGSAEMPSIIFDGQPDTVLAIVVLHSCVSKMHI